MNRRSLGMALSVAFWTVVVAVPAFGQNLEPAIPVDTTPEAASALDWTYRYLIPTALVLGVLVIVLTSIRYFTNVVRKRYRIVEE